MPLLILAIPIIVFLKTIKFQIKKTVTKRVIIQQKSYNHGINNMPLAIF